MGMVTAIRDRLTNVMSGMGTTADKRTAGFYAFVPVSGQEAEAAYRTSWLTRKIVDVPPFDMTREWRDWQAEAASIEKLEAEERRLQLKAKCQRALVLARLFGGSALILGTKDSDTTQPIDANRVGLAGLQYIHVMSRWQLSEGSARLDPADPWFGQPDFFTINGGNGQQVKLHPSRVIAFIGQKAPEGGFYGSQSWFWGDPIMQSIGEAVKNADLAQSAFSALIDEAKLDIIKIPDLMSQTSTEEGEKQVLRRLAAANMGKSNWRALMLDSAEDWQQRQITWTGIPEIIEAFLLVVAGAADVPMTRLLGQSPRGLQSTGDGEERDYHAMVRARQNELLGPALDRVDELLIRSALGTKPTDVYWEFAPLGGVTEKDAAQIEYQYAQGFKLRADSGEFDPAALATIEKNRMVESGRYPGSETAFEEAETAAAAEPDPADNSDQLTTLEQRVAAMEQKGLVSAADAIALIRDASPRTLYVSRKLLNADAVLAWANKQGFTSTLAAADMHVTVLSSREPVDWMAMGSGWDQDADGKLKVAPGGARIVDQFGDATVLLFSCSALSWRHEEMVRNGASHDFNDYQPHVTLSYEAPADLDLSKVEPYRGELVFGPEIFAEAQEDWQSNITEA